MFQIKNLTVEADHKKILNDFNLDLQEGAIHALMGPNGTGKSTLCRVILQDPEYNVT